MSSKALLWLVTNGACYVSTDMLWESISLPGDWHCTNRRELLSGLSIFAIIRIFTLGDRNSMNSLSKINLIFLQEHICVRPIT